MALLAEREGDPLNIPKSPPNNPPQEKRQGYGFRSMDLLAERVGKGLINRPKSPASNPSKEKKQGSASRSIVLLAERVGKGQ